MKDLTLFVLGKEDKIKEDNNIEMIYNGGNGFIDKIKKAKGKYIAFIKEEDKIAKEYLKIIIEKTKENFDCCFINYDVLYEYKNKVKICTNSYELSKIKPYYGDYIWSFIFKKSKLVKLLDIEDENEFNEIVDKEFNNSTAIGELLYFHNPKGKRIIKNLQYVDTKRNAYYKNIIYIGDGCRGLFNGYISWINNLGRCFGKKYDVTILYDQMHHKTFKTISKYFKCIERKNDINYVCDRLLVTYSTYFYPKNIFTLDQNYLFIHGNMSDYENTKKYTDDVFSHYIAVSKVSAEKAVGYFPTKNIEHIINPYKLDKELVKPHLKLTSAFRYCDVKKPERVEKMAKIMTDLEIPYTWNLFTDKKENTNVGGLIYRNRTANPLPYIQDSDYFVLLSDSEAMPYCILEALAVNTKVVVTPLEAYDELGLKNDENATIIPFEYFDDNNEELLKGIIKKMYEEKEKKVKYKIDESLWEDYNKIFIK